jgi:hypothetical protein
MLHTVKRRRASWIGDMLRRTAFWNTLLKIWCKEQVAGRRGRRRLKQLLDDLKETRGYRKLKEEALDRTVWRTGFGRGCGPVVRQTAEWMNGWYLFILCIECRVARMQTRFCQSCPHHIQGWQACLKEWPSSLRAKKLHGLVHRRLPLGYALSIHSVLRVYFNIILIVSQIILAVVSHITLVFSRVRHWTVSWARWTPSASHTQLLQDVCMLLFFWTKCCMFVPFLKIVQHTFYFVYLSVVE